MRVHLVNPSDLSFGTAVITPRWLYVLASATPASFGAPRLIDETLESFDTSAIAAGDVVGIGIHTGNALRGYEIGAAARAAGAYVVYGGIHASLYPDEARELGGAHAVSLPSFERGHDDSAATDVEGDVAGRRVGLRHRHPTRVGRDRGGQRGGAGRVAVQSGGQDVVVAVVVDDVLVEDHATRLQVLQLALGEDGAGDLSVVGRVDPTDDERVQLPAPRPVTEWMAEIPGQVLHGLEYRPADRSYWACTSHPRRPEPGWWQLTLAMELGLTDADREQWGLPARGTVPSLGAAVMRAG